MLKWLVSQKRILRVLLFIPMVLYGGQTISQRSNSKPDDPGKLFVGTWEPANKRSDYLRIEVSAISSSIRIIVWTKSTRDSVSWPARELIVFSDSVSGRVFKKAMATWKVDFGEQVCILTIVNNTLKLDMFTRFTDKSKRSNYTVSEQFVKRRAPATR